MSDWSHLCSLTIITVWIGLFSSRANAEDWTMFGRDATRNPISPEKDPPVDWNIGKIDGETGQWIKNNARNIRWVARLGSITAGDPVVVDGLVWVGTNNASFDSKTDASVLACFRERDGKLLYKYVSPRLPNARWQDWVFSSMACSPLVHGDRVWFTTNRCEAVCLDIGPLKRDAGEPRVIWKYDMIKELGVYLNGAIMNYTRFSSFASYKTRIFVITGNGASRLAGRKLDVPAPGAPSLVCFDKYSGEVLWTDNSPGANILSGQWASPLVAEIAGRVQVIAPQGDGWMRSFDALSGELIWKFDMNNKTSNWVAGGRGTRNTILATPILYENRIYLAAGQQINHGDGLGRLCCIDPTKTGDISSELAVGSDGKVLRDRRLQAVDPTQGERAIENPNSGLFWEFSEEDQNRDGQIDFEEGFHRTVSSVAIKDGLLIAGDLSGLVHCFDSGTGQRHWTYDTLARIVAPPLIVDDKVYLADDDGAVAIFRLSADPTKAMRHIGGDWYPINAEPIGDETAVNGVRVAAHVSPIFANGTLYLTSRSHLYAITRDRDAGTERSQELSDLATRPKRPDRRVGPRSGIDPTPQDVVEKMLESIQVTKQDVVYDLGSGDGRIVITAAQRYGCRAVGYEIDRELVELSRGKANSVGLKDRVRFERADIFTADLSGGDVIALYLLPSQLELLLPQLQKLKPGSRIVSHQFEIPGIEPDKTLEVESAIDGFRHEIHIWITPLAVP